MNDNVGASTRRRSAKHQPKLVIKYNPSRPILAVYSYNGSPKMVCRGIRAENMVLNCLRHMRANDYGADIAEVYDAYTGEVHAVVTLSRAGEFKIVFEREYDKEQDTIKMEELKRKKEHQMAKQ